MPNSVRYYESTMSGAPSLSNTAGALIGVLDACLVDGFGSVTVDSLVVASNVVTATVSAGHQFAMVGNTGPVIRIAGASPSVLNGDWRVTVTSSTVFTFTTSGIVDQTATGTISAKRAPAGFSKSFSGTNKAAYRSDDVTGTRLYFRVDDSTTTYARIRGFEVMTDVDTGTGPFPTDAQLSGGGYVLKANTTGTGWRMYADSRAIYLCINDQTWQSTVFFGDCNSYVGSDAFACCLAAHTSTSITTAQINVLAGSAGWIARSYTQLGGSVVRNQYSHGISSFVGAGGQAYPSPVDNSVHFWPVEFWEGSTIARGMMPGMWDPIHNNNPPDMTAVEDIANLPGRTVLIQTIRAGRMGIDITGPWR